MLFEETQILANRTVANQEYTEPIEIQKHQNHGPRKAM